MINEQCGGHSLAAGRGTRFGGDLKLLALLGGKALVRDAAEAAVGSSADPVTVVTGHRAEEVAEALQGLLVQIIQSPCSPMGFRRH